MKKRNRAHGKLGVSPSFAIESIPYRYDWITESKTNLGQDSLRCQKLGFSQSNVLWEEIQITFRREATSTEAKGTYLI